MLKGEKIHRIGIRGEVALQVKVGGCRCGTSRLAGARRKVSSKTLKLIGSERFILGTREVAGDITKKLCRVAERQEAFKAELKEVFAEQQHHLSPPQHPHLARETESMGIRTKQLVTPRMKGFDRRRCVAVGHQPINTPLHLLGRPLSKRQCQDLFGFGALLSDEPSHAPGDDLRFACARASNHQEWTFTVCDSGVLLVV